MNGVELLIIGIALALAGFAAYALRRGREQRAQEVENLVRLGVQMAQIAQKGERVADPEFQALDAIEWWNDLSIWSHEPEGA